MNSNSKLTTGQMVGVGAAVLVLLLFFFPWIELNLLLATTNLSGFQLATGSGPAGANFPGVPSLLLVPLSMLAVLGLVAFGLLSSNKQLKGVAAVFFIGAGAISGLIIIYQYLNLNQELNQNILGMITQKMFTYSFGAHGSLIGSAIVSVGGVLDLMTVKKPV
ncbi:MAG TPA: hypothetical protein VJ875_15670 [Pyrinomonadaceae bacterium]|nr:hypothetical protein [Pyrinomonadaceae bacterium]